MNFRSLKQYKDMPESAKALYDTNFESLKKAGASATSAHYQAYRLAKTVWDPPHPRNTKKSNN